MLVTIKKGCLEDGFKRLLQDCLSGLFNQVITCFFFIYITLLQCYSMCYEFVSQQICQ